MVAAEAENTDDILTYLSNSLQKVEKSIPVTCGDSASVRVPLADVPFLQLCLSTSAYFGSADAFYLAEKLDDVNPPSTDTG